MRTPTKSNPRGATVPPLFMLAEMEHPSACSLFRQCCAGVWVLGSAFSQAAQRPAAPWDLVFWERSCPFMRHHE